MSTKSERQEVVQSAGQAGSSGRSSALGENDPRHRRVPQSESVALQRFDPAHFSVDANNRVALQPAVTAAVTRSVVSIEGTTTTVNSDASVYTRIPLTKNSSSGSQITVNANDIALSVGYVYLVEVGSSCTAQGASSNRTMTLAIRDHADTVLADMAGTAPDSYGFNTFRVAAVVDTTEGSSDSTIHVAVKGNNANVKATNPWITVQSL